MTEKEKMLAGLLYDGTKDIELLEERRACQMKCWQYNNLPPIALAERNKQIEDIFGSIGENFCIEQPFHCDYGKHIIAGKNFYVNYNCVILDCNYVTFGDNVLIAPNCGFYTAGHALIVEQRIAGLEYAHPITVGDNVWFGGNTVVLPGVTIGSDTVIGAGSVVKTDIPAGVIAVGNPCRVVRSLTEIEKQQYVKQHPCQSKV